MGDSHDWSGEAENPLEDFVPSEQVTLPVGVPKDGQRYREISLEELSGVDDHLVASKEARTNGAVATSLVIMRCTQEVEGLLPRKQNPDKKFDRAYAREMTQIDRDFILSRIYMLSDKNEVIMAGKCPRCGDIWEETAYLSKLEVIEWDDDKKLEMPFELEVGVPVKNDMGETIYHKEGMLRFPLGKDSELLGRITNQAEAVDSTIAACVTRLGTLDHIDQDQAKKMKSRDRQKIIATIQRDFPGLKQWKEVTCTCGRDFDIVCDLTAFLDGRRKKQKE